MRKDLAMRRVVLLFLVFLTFFPPLLADEGKIPVYEPTSITQPGHYILTRDILDPTAGTTISISANDVTFDLNGHTIATTDFSTILVSSTGTGVSIQNGRLRSVQLVALSGTFSRVQDLEISGEFFNAAVSVSGVDRFVRNTVVANGDTLVQITSNRAEIAGNTFTYGGTYLLDLIGDNNTVRSNHFAASGNAMTISGDGNLIAENVVPSNMLAGIILSGEGNVVVNNLLPDVSVSGGRNTIDNNRLTTGYCAIDFADTNYHVYRDNVMVNSITICNGGPPNIDAGGNTCSAGLCP